MAYLALESHPDFVVNHFAVGNIHTTMVSMCHKYVVSFQILENFKASISCCFQEFLGKLNLKVIENFHINFA